MNHIQTIGRWFFGVLCVASGLQNAEYVYQRVTRDHDWPAHLFTIAMVFCCFVAAYGLFAQQRWFFLASIVVAADAALSGLVGIVFTPTISLNLTVSILYFLLGMSFLAWLLLPGVRPRSEVGSA